MKYLSFIASIMFVFFSSQLVAQSSDQCGEEPVAPALVDGSTSTMQQLASNSKEVNAYIAKADDFLDCSEARYKKLSSSKVHRDELAGTIKSITASRNDIGDQFNDQVAAFKVANP